MPRPLARRPAAELRPRSPQRGATPAAASSTRGAGEPPAFPPPPPAPGGGARAGDLERARRR
eukprot:15424191-Alexandrium_andersonii.AAC.1